MAYLKYGVLIEITDTENFDSRLAAKQNTQMFNGLSKTQKEHVRHYGYNNRGKENIVNSRKLLTLCIDGELPPIPTPGKSVSTIENPGQEQVSIPTISNKEVDELKEIHTQEIEQKDEIINSHISQAKSDAEKIADLERALVEKQQQLEKITDERDKLFNLVTDNSKIHNAIAGIDEKLDNLTLNSQEPVQIVSDDNEELEKLRKENIAKDIAIKELKKHFAKIGVKTEETKNDTTVEVEEVPAPDPVQKSEIVEEVIIEAISDENQVPQEVENVTPVVSEEKINLVDAIKSTMAKSRWKSKMNVETMAQRIKENYPDLGVEFKDVVYEVKNNPEFTFKEGIAHIVE